MVSVNPGYALGQLERALEASASHSDPAVRERNRARATQWKRVIEGMGAGTLAIGSRTPTTAPAWATLAVMHGGFATGGLAAEGPLLAHEQEVAERLGIQPVNRRTLALHFLSDDGRAELGALLASGCYRVDVPEEGAMLAIAALVARGHAELAATIVDAIAPYLDRLRFHPQPASRPITAVSSVHVATVGETRASLAQIATPLEVRRMNEALTVWAPLTDRAVDLCLETVEDGVPGRSCTADWRARADAVLADHAAARAKHTLCKKPHHPKQNLAILVRGLATLRVAGATLGARELGLVRSAIAGHVRKHGGPGSERRAAHRDTQARVAALPTRAESATTLAARLAAFPADAGLSSIDGVKGPLAEGPHAGAPLWPSVAAKLVRCLDASVEELVERGVLTSGEAIARVLPQISAHVRAMGFADPEIARLYAAVDAAFRRRRSLLLLDYSSQVKLEELPWLAALEPLRSSDGASKEGAQRLFSSVAALAISSFPHAILPNPLLEELAALAKRAEIELPIVDELAADIFMGGFTAKFVRAAEIAARRLEGTLYARYYGLPIDEVGAIAASLPPKEPTSFAARAAAAMSKAVGRRPGAGPVPAFGALCERRAEIEPGLAHSVARNGRIIEQQQILTTQNLVPLIDAAGLGPEQFAELAWRSFEWLVKRVQVKVSARIERLRTAKNAAYAWRQAIAYLSMADPSATDEFLARATAHIAGQPEPYRSRFTSLLAGIESAHAGRAPELRLLGWTLGPHPLIDD